MTKPTRKKKSYTFVGLNNTTGSIVDPENITAVECLALAQAGKYAWNTWRRAHPTRKSSFGVANVAQFSMHAFFDDPIDFSEFEFGDGAQFEGVQFGDETRFRGAQLGDGALFEGAHFGDMAHFEDAHFGDDAGFKGATFGVGARFEGTRFGDDVLLEDVRFGDEARFSRAQFGLEAWFNGAQFGDNAQFQGARFDLAARFEGAKFGEGADFEGAKFGDGAWFARACLGARADFNGTQFGNTALFEGAQFGDCANFAGAQFGDDAWFVGTQFGNDARFESVKFGDGARFDGAQFGGWVVFEGAQFGNNARFDGREWSNLQLIYGDNFAARKEWAVDRGIAPDILRSISFNGACFRGGISFSGRTFTGVTGFGILASTKPSLKRTPVTFGSAPNFHNSRLHQDTSFEGAIWPKAQGSEGAARAYRTLKLASSAQLAVREEQMFFRMEMREEAMQLPRSSALRWLYDAYWVLSNFGFSLWRPAVAWLFSVALFAALFSVTADAPRCWLWQSGCVFRGGALELSFLNALPIPGLDKLTEVLSGKVSSTLAAIERALALLWLFLLGLALRNRYKMK